MSETCCYLCGEVARDPKRDLIAQMAALPTPYSGFVALETSRFAVLPSLGALAEGHVLVCPKKHVRGVARLDPASASEFGVLRGRLRRVLRHLYRLPVHGFEHGPALAGRVPCTVEHAHYHMLPAAAQVLPTIRKDFAWFPFNGTPGALGVLAGDREYLWYDSPSGHAHVAVGGPFPSQYFRLVSPGS